ncbi:polyhydroxyalkanoate synthesis repressor PhaR [uncultured Sphingosinicella sp.]|uniref:polyhydroxyalkanoate synthesis repressor PhaR n=1 Tax=uncultured Sphingosinicella sp. TaxID=478748 RepID=UPI0030DD2D5C|tara:strand:- start:37055 stop:37600 length:546 start_codon:yes stop_codon:yes gene_type:complete
MSDEETKSDPIIIKKYANRRLYNTGSSSYITLDHLGEMTREGIDFKVVDAKSGDDITRSVLTQIIMDEENRGQTMLPTPFLRQLIAMYGDSMQSMVPPYLEASMAALRRNQEQFRKSMAGAFNPFETIAKQNMAMFEAAASMMAGKTPPEGGAPAEETSELADLKREMAELQAKLDKLGKK